MASTLEETVRQEQEAHDTQPAPPAAANGEQPMFDPSDYDREDLAIGKVDGHGVDKIAVHFTGRVMLDRSNPADVALYNRLSLGREEELRVAGKVQKVGTGWTTNREGDLDAIVGERTLKIDTVWVLEAEEL